MLPEQIAAEASRHENRRAMRRAYERNNAYSQRNLSALLLGSR